MANIREILSKNMRENRQKLGITQTQLAERADISTNFVAMIELMHKFPSPEILDRIAAALNIETSALFTAQASEEDVMKRLQKVFFDNIDQAIEKAIDKAIDAKFGKNLSN
jgi:transcriptional regulator with XRE-family HTH domain